VRAPVHYADKPLMHRESQTEGDEGLSLLSHSSCDVVRQPKVGLKVVEKKAIIIVERTLNGLREVELNACCVVKRIALHTYMDSLGWTAHIAHSYAKKFRGIPSFS
jgi:hypothetical protein